MHDQIHSYGSLEQILEESVAAYRSVLDSVVTHTPKLARAGGDWRKSLRQLSLRLDGQLSVSLFKETSKSVEKELAQWGKSTLQAIEIQERETKEAMAAVAVVAEVLSSQESTYGVRFRGISRKLKLLTTSNDIAEIRRKMQNEVELLEQYVEEMSRANVQALGRLQHIQKPEEPVAVPPEVEISPAAPHSSDLAKAILAHVRKEDRVAVVVLRLLGSTARADSRAMPDLVARMAEAFESPSLSGQIYQGTFVAVTRLPLPEAIMRMDVVERDLANKLGGKIESHVFEKTPGQTATDLIARVEPAGATAVRP